MQPKVFHVNEWAAWDWLDIRALGLNGQWQDSRAHHTCGGGRAWDLLFPCRVVGIQAGVVLLKLILAMSGSTMVVGVYCIGRGVVSPFEV